MAVNMISSLTETNKNLLVNPSRWIVATSIRLYWSNTSVLHNIHKGGEAGADLRRVNYTLEVWTALDKARPLKWTWTILVPL